MTGHGFGIIGCGMISEYHAAAIAELEKGELVAVSSRNEENAKKLTAQYGVPWHRDYGDLIKRDDVDVVCVCSPSGAHMEMAVAAAEAGKHVVVEKPIEITLERADAIIQACDENRVELCAVFPSRFQDASRTIKDALDRGRFGRLTVGDLYNKWWRVQEYYDSGGWRGTQELDGGGALMNQAIHGVDLLQWFMGPVKTICAMTDCLTHERIEVEDTAVAVLRFESGALGTIEATTSIYPGYPRRIELHGDAGTVVYAREDILNWDFAEELPEDEEIRARFVQKAGVSGGVADPRAISHEFHRRQFADFLAAIDEGREPLVHGREGRKALEIILAVYESQRRKAPVDLPLQ